jgi:hypothetical protein
VCVLRLRRDESPRMRQHGDMRTSQPCVEVQAPLRDGHDPPPAILGHQREKGRIESSVLHHVAHVVSMWQRTSATWGRHDLQVQHAERCHSRGLSQEHHLGHEAGNDRRESQDSLKCAIRGEEDGRDNMLSVPGQAPRTVCMEQSPRLRAPGNGI